MPSMHVFTALNQERNEIRLLHLDQIIPTENDSFLGLTGHSECVSLLDAPKYKALSYVWGNPSATSAIFLNDWSYIPIAANLLEAFLRISAVDSTSVSLQRSIEAAIEGCNRRYGLMLCVWIMPMTQRRVGKSR
ncbi:hypothetical protein BU25DRAFT_136118 [Macroventuria anomochaeta]|uniref:Uncharacterized protein n=1 Tax=Macroventuria anomochaeta TaxID=301207 RepID=A0ACB6SF24_9PLEO|nr:uncharacterized protein BU25DRAFT_136118 [Macroventuria anomochaeta]KAF2631928.1 hypothetical protein BU25DRAFT_136118 [Macroventuria anomochaeta]